VVVCDDVLVVVVVMVAAVDHTIHLLLDMGLW
jgi:hypothetical protein